MAISDTSLTRVGDQPTSAYVSWFLETPRSISWTTMRDIRQFTVTRVSLRCSLLTVCRRFCFSTS